MIRKGPLKVIYSAHKNKILSVILFQREFTTRSMHNGHGRFISHKFNNSNEHFKDAA